MNINCLFSARSSPVHINMSSAFRGWNARTYIYGIRIQRDNYVCHKVVVVNAKSSCGYYLYYYSYVSMLCTFYFLLIELTIGSTKTNREDSSSARRR